MKMQQFEVELLTATRAPGGDPEDLPGDFPIDPPVETGDPANLPGDFPIDPPVETVDLPGQFPIDPPVDDTKDEK